MIRDERWKLIYERGLRRRTDGYDTERPLTPRHFRLYDLAHDPNELHDVSNESANAEIRQRLTNLLVEHLVKTARPGAPAPRDADWQTILDECVQPHDVTTEKTN